MFEQNFELIERCKEVHCVDLGESFPTQSSFQIDPNSNAYLLAKFGFDTAENEPCTVSRGLFLVERGEVRRGPSRGPLRRPACGGSATPPVPRGPRAGKRAGGLDVSARVRTASQCPSLV